MNAKLPVTTTVVGSNYHVVSNNLKGGNIEPLYDLPQSLDKFRDTHKQVTEIEALWRADRRKGFILSNTKPKFINLDENL